MKKLIVLCLLLLSCHPKIIDNEPIAPRAVLVSELTLTTLHRANKVKKNTVEIKSNINSLQTEINKGYSLADKIRKSGTATHIELESNYKNWESVNIKNQFLETVSKTAVIDATELENAAEKAKNETALLRDDAVKSDKKINDLKTEILKQAPDVARGKMVTNAFWIIIITLLLGGIGLLILRLLPFFLGR